MQNQLARLDRARTQFIAHRRTTAHADLLARRLPRACSPTDLDERRGAQFLDQIRGGPTACQPVGRAAGPGRAGVPALSRCARSRPTSASSRARSRRSSRRPPAPRLGVHARPAAGAVSSPQPLRTPSGSAGAAILLDTLLLHTPARGTEFGFRGQSNGTFGWRSPPGPRDQAPEHAAHLRAVFTPTKRAQGAGLGLAIAREARRPTSREAAEPGARSPARLRSRWSCLRRLS